MFSRIYAHASREGGLLTRMKVLLVIGVVAACGSQGNNGGGIDAAPDSKVFMDAPPNVPAMIAIGGTASADTNTGSMPLDGVAIALYKTTDETTPIATATTDAQGKYSVMVATGGHVVDAWIKATKSGYVENDMYPAAPFQADAPSTDASMITTSNFNLLKIFGGGHAGNGLIIIEILDATSTAVAGATVTSSPAAGGYRYSDTSGAPTSTTGTAADGTAFMFDVPPGQVQIMAAKTGMTFKAHGLNAHADTFTTTVIYQQ
jgi:hypothetical protein